jgi:D-alanine-D-alanine ligase
MEAAVPDLGPVLVLAGGLSHERDVSLRSGRRVAEALRDEGVDVSVRDVDAGLVRELQDHPPTIVLPLLHGAAGEDGALRGVLELLGTPYLGTPARECRTAFDKPSAIAAVARAGLVVPRTMTLPQSAFRDLGAEPLLRAVVDDLGLPLVVRPARGGSALGCSVVRSWEDLPSAMVSCFAYGDDAVVQPCITGTEVAVSVVAPGGPTGTPQALPAVEIVPDGGIYDYQARYTAGATEFFVPARLEPAVAAAVADVAVRAHTILGLRDFSRTDCIVDAEGTVWFLEVNVAPGCTETSLLPLAVEASGQSLGRLFVELLEARVAASGVRTG